MISRLRTAFGGKSLPGAVELTRGPLGRCFCVSNIQVRTKTPEGKLKEGVIILHGLVCACVVVVTSLLHTPSHISTSLRVEQRVA